MTTPPPGQPGNPFSQQPFDGQTPTYGQPPAPGQQPPYNPPPAPPAQSPFKKILRIAAPIVVVIAVIAIVYAFNHKDDGESIKTTAVGSCITVTEGSGLNVETKAIDCDNSETPSFIVGAKLATSDACEKAGYNAYVYETGSGATDEVLCLSPNYQLGKCYEEGSVSIGLKLKTVACTETSSMFSTAFKITERADAKTVPNCTGPTKKLMATEIQSDPARAVSVCAEILGEGYVWK